MSNKSFDKRIAFIRRVLIEKITDNVNLANSWYCNNKAKNISNDEAISKFKEWLAH
jgi:hypothetical protein